MQNYTFIEVRSFNSSLAVPCLTRNMSIVFHINQATTLVYTRHYYVHYHKDRLLYKHKHDRIFGFVLLIKQSAMSEGIYKLYIGCLNLQAQLFLMCRCD